MRLCRKLGQCMGDFAKIAKETGLTVDDVQEFCGHVHALQNAVMAQAARRAHRAEFR